MNRCKQRSIVLTLVSCCITIAVLAILWMGWEYGVIDSRWRRELVAARIRALEVDYRSDPSNIDSLRKIESAAASKYRFEAVHALATLGGVGGSDVSTSVLVDGLLSDDPYVRHAAAGSLAEMGVYALPAKDALIQTIRQHEIEGTATYAAESLGNIGDTSSDAGEEKGSGRKRGRGEEKGSGVFD